MEHRPYLTSLMNSCYAALCVITLQCLPQPHAVTPPETALVFAGFVVALRRRRRWATLTFLNEPISEVVNEFFGFAEDKCEKVSVFQHAQRYVVSNLGRG